MLHTTKDKPLTQKLNINLDLPVSEKVKNSFTVSRGGTEFFQDPLDRPLKVLIVGIERTENQFTRAMRDYGIVFEHLDGDGAQTKWPEADAAIICTSHAGHKAFWSLKEEYRAREKKVFFPRQGFTEIKVDFEHHFFKFIRDTEALQISHNAKIHLYLCFFARKIGAKFTRTGFADWCDKVVKDGVSVADMNNFLTEARKRGLVQMEKRGYYSFLGFNKALIDQFSRRIAPGVPVPGVWIQKVGMPIAPTVLEEVPSPIIEEEAPIIVAPTIAEIIPVIEVKTEPKVEQVIGAKSRLTTDEKMDLLLSHVSEMEAKMESVIIGPSQDQLISDIQERLHRLSRPKLRAVLDLIS